MIMPTATSNNAVETIVLTPSTTASNTSHILIGLGDSHEAATTLIIANAAEVVGVLPETRKPTSTIIGIIKCQPSFKTSETLSESEVLVGVSFKRFASIRTK